MIAWSRRATARSTGSLSADRGAGVPREGRVEHAFGLVSTQDGRQGLVRPGRGQPRAHVLREPAGAMRPGAERPCGRGPAAHRGAGGAHGALPSQPAAQHRQRQVGQFGGSLPDHPAEVVEQGHQVGQVRRDGGRGPVAFRGQEHPVVPPGPRPAARAARPAARRWSCARRTSSHPPDPMRPIRCARTDAPVIERPAVVIGDLASAVSSWWLQRVSVPAAVAGHRSPIASGWPLALDLHVWTESRPGHRAAAGGAPTDVIRNLWRTLGPRTGGSHLRTFASESPIVHL